MAPLTGKQLFEMWAEGSVKEAIEDIALRNEFLHFDPPIPRPTNLDEIYAAYEDPRMQAYVYKEAQDRIFSFTAQIERFILMRDEATTPEAKDFYAKELREYRRHIRVLSRIRPTHITSDD